MNIYRVDLNLLSVFHALIETRSVTLAAERFGITQPAMSNALARLRGLLADPLFVQTSNGMQPTPYALEIMGSVQKALQEAEAALQHGKAFDPSSSDRAFRFHMTDFGQLYFLPLLLERLRPVAPNVRIDTETLSLEVLREALEDGRTHMALGRLPKLVSRGVHSKTLFYETYGVMLRAGHKLDRKRISLQAFLEAEHVVVSSAGGGHAVVEETLLKNGVRICARTANFTAIPMILLRTDLLAITPTRLALEFAKTGTYRFLPLPIEIPTYEVNVFWHERFDADPANRWMRERVVECFGE